MHRHGEPSVEAILESIKKVIARDDSGGFASASGAPLELGPEHSLAAEAQQPPLLTAAAADSMRQSLAGLTGAGPGAPADARSGTTPAEALLRELLRPALAQWLDRNLPPLVERMVAAEIARITGRHG